MSKEIVAEPCPKGCGVSVAGATKAIRDEFMTRHLKVVHNVEREQSIKRAVRRRENAAALARGARKTVKKK
jgi:hypothetical protein